MFCARYPRYHTCLSKSYRLLSPQQQQQQQRTIQSNKPKNQQNLLRQQQQQQSHSQEFNSATSNYLFNLYNRKNHKTEEEDSNKFGDDTSFNPLFNQAISDLYSHSEYNDIVHEQIKLEQKSVKDTALKYQKLMGGATQRNQGASLPPARKVLMEWFNPLTELIRQRQKQFHQSRLNNIRDDSILNEKEEQLDENNGLKSEDLEEAKFLKDVGPYICLLPADELAVIAIHSILSACLSGGRVLVSSAAQNVGRAVCAQVNILKLKKAKRAHVLSYLPRNSQFIHNVNHMASVILPEEEPMWGKDLCVRVGTFLINLLVHVAKVPIKPNTNNNNNLSSHLNEVEKKNMDIDGVFDSILQDIVKDEKQNESNRDEVITEPAFYHEVHFYHGKKYGVITPNEILSDIITEAHTLRESVDPILLPMIVQPRPWVGFKDGGYLSVVNMVMRTQAGSRFQSLVLQDAMLQDLFEGLNVLSETEWSINKDLFEVVLKVWQAGGGIGALPKRQDDPVPERPFDVDPANMDKETAAEFRKWKKEVEKIRQGNRDLHSLRCDMLYKLQVARDFQDRSFFFPHNVDFRGRAYPIPPHLNHLGADINRGLLLFTVRKPITERGIFWLKVHLANLYGKDKYSFDERIQFVDENLHNIMKSADNPLPGLDLELNADDIYNSIHRTTTTNTSIKKLRIEECWWLQSENPWQTLAACIELTKCLRSPNPAEYETGLPIQMDGSCNGLQHYAALGRDNLGGLHVNLLPTEKPMDVYVGVLEVVKKHVDKDAANGNELAKLLQGNVYRSTIKQTVMTSVYGVTFVGAREQIYRRLREKKDIPEDKLYAASIYLASVTLHSLGEIFQSAKGIMDWLNEVAHIVTSANQPVIWITPLGLPVVQPYRSARKTCVKTVLQNVTLTSMSDELPVNQARQKSAFPPNYVHSLDASHMFMTARECKKRGIEFASVHDSFWTHPADVDTMNSIIREEFIKLHSQPLLETLLDALKKLHPGLKFPPVPKQGGLKLERVRDSPYFFD